MDLPAQLSSFYAVHQIPLHGGLGIEEDIVDDNIETSDHYDKGALKKQPYEGIPSAAWSRRLDDLFPGHKQFQVGIKEGLKLMGIGYRMWRYLKREKEAGRVPIMDPFNSPKVGPILGVPCGGIGGGSIGRGWRGEFVKWQLDAGMTHIHRVDANQFSARINVLDDGEQSSKVAFNFPKKVCTALYPGHPKNEALNNWNWGLRGNHSTYHALFPFAWTVYDEVHPNIRLVCKQISPVFPHDYKESSLPCTVFVWKIENDGPLPADVSLMFTWKNGTGTIDDKMGGHFNKTFRSEVGKIQENQTESDSFDSGVNLSEINLEEIFGITLHHKRTQYVKTNLNESSSSNPRDAVYHDPLTFAIAVKKTPDVEVTYNLNWATDNENDATNLWRDFSEDGSLGDPENDHHLESHESEKNREGSEMGVALVAKTRVSAGEKKELAFCLTWDSPIARFVLGSAYYRRYTRFFGRDGNAAPKLAIHALNSYKIWEQRINGWQQPILDDVRVPSWYKMGLINELYYLVAGGTVWTNGAVGKEEEEENKIKENDYIGHFAYLESQEYLMYNTYDVHFYASFALAQLWPQLELSLQKDVGFAALESHPEKWVLIGSGDLVSRKIRGAIPHDMGNPGEDPWKKVNSYNIQDIGRWKDLPSKFVLQVYRDYICTGDIGFVNELWSIIVEVLDRLITFDKDNDGIVDNEGFPDQTYDIWNVEGCSAYSGGLYLAALQAAIAMASLMNHTSLVERYQNILEKGKNSYENKLWNGKYYNYDSSKSTQHDSIMADQLAGHWYSVACGLDGILSREHAKSALYTIFENNVKKFASKAGGDLIGAVNGCRPDGTIDTTCLQSAEVWTGTTFALASTMIQEGMMREGFDTAKGVILGSFQKWGYQFQTPEAWDQYGNYRAVSYMRPLSIWAMHWALNRQKEQKDGVNKTSNSR